MKLGTNGVLECHFGVKRARLGSVNAGGVFLYRRRLWIVLNPCQTQGGKLVRTLEGAIHKSQVLPSKTAVWYLDTSKCGKVQ